MAFITDTRNASLSLGDRFANFRANLAEATAKRKIYKTTLTELSALSSRDLADLGLHRSQIKTVAYEAAYGN
ncbi:DUF1127 domain-containing protein [Yoonia sp. SS1-5]|uniref:DUF1127 domain-containing protein n=1 Tax=Yoonia rhodophyticola TaxID=3137370 RepID=A0AAN0NK47_9RHOB